MLLPLVSPQLLKAAVPLSTIIRTAGPIAVVLDAQVDRIPMALDIGGANKRLAAADPGTRCALLDGVDWPEWE